MTGTNITFGDITNAGTTKFADAVFQSFSATNINSTSLKTNLTSNSINLDTMNVVTWNINGTLSAPAYNAMDTPGNIT